MIVSVLTCSWFVPCMCVCVRVCVRLRVRVCGHVCDVAHVLALARGGASKSETCALEEKCFASFVYSCIRLFVRSCIRVLVCW